MKFLGTSKKRIWILYFIGAAIIGYALTHPSITSWEFTPHVLIFGGFAIAIPLMILDAKKRAKSDHDEYYSKNK